MAFQGAGEPARELPEQGPDPAPTSGAAAPRRRPDWLVGPDEGFVSELERKQKERELLPRPVLFRPGGGPPVPVEAPPGRPGEPASIEEEPPPRELDVAPPAPEPAAAPVAWSAAASSLPLPPRLARPKRRVEPEFDDLEIQPAKPEFPSGKEAPEKPAGHALAPLEEPWWVVFGDNLRHDWRMLVAAAAGLALLVAGLWLVPRRDPGTPLSEIRSHPGQFDGRSVVVTGSVGDVFPLGGGHAFYFVQGRDTIVAFTRSRVPVPRQRLRLEGQISTGFLDGLPRQALFEKPR
ncbi:MAG: hypothetical protein HZC42_14140 [Candidatus Eisenbacteria bacterium]|nr:hypothetical protein [Candidatus Eisenbacteria bacterium]